MSIKRDVLKCVLKDIGKSSYPILERFVPLLQNQDNSEYLHNDQQLKIDDPSMKTWDGNGSSIPISFINLNVFKNKKFDLDIMISKKSDNKLKDHMFLQFEDIIIDTSWRSLFLKNNIDYKNTDEYSKLLFKEKNFALVGTITDINYIHSVLDFKHNQLYKTDILDNLNIWKKGINVNNHFPESFLRQSIKNETQLQSDYEFFNDCVKVL